MDILVLVIDPHVPARRALIEQLREWDVFAIGVATAQEAMNLIMKGGVFDAVVMDEMLDAVADSQSFVRWLRGLDCDIPVAVLTEHAGTRKPIEAPGCVDILVKPPAYGFVAQIIANKVAALRAHNSPDCLRPRG